MKILMFIGVILLVVGLTGLRVRAATDEAPAPAKPVHDFKSLDTNGDGKISLDEFTAPAEQLRAAKRGKGHAAEKQKSADDSNGISSPVDSIEGRFTPEVFQQLDINHDKFLSPAELDALLVNAHNISQP